MSNKKEKSSKSKKSGKESKETVGQNDEDVIDLCDDHDYQVLSAVFETDSGRNIAEILSRLQKDVHILAMSVHQLIQLSLASQRVQKDDSDGEDEDGEDGEDEDGEDEDGEDGEGDSDDEDDKDENSK